MVRGRGGGICAIDENAGLAENLAEHGIVGRDDRKAGILRLEQGQAEPFLVRRAKQRIGLAAGCA